MRDLFSLGKGPQRKAHRNGGKMNNTDKIYVAGHRGLVGSAIVRSLEARGYTNVIGRTHHELDLTDQQAVRDFFEAEKPDVVVLAAAKVGDRKSVV